MKKRIRALLFQLPAILILVIAFIASFIIKVIGTHNFSWGGPLLLLIVIAAYFWGRKLESETEILKD